MTVTHIKKTSPLKIGFIGGSIESAIGNTHKIASQMDDVFHLEAGCFSTDAKTNVETARSWNITPSRMYNDWQSLLEHENNALDAVVVLTPTPDHYPIIERALDLQIPVISEKALTTSSDHALAIQKKINEQNGFLAVTYNYSGYPMIRELKHRILRGELGNLLHVQIEMPQEGFLRKNHDYTCNLPQSWRQRDWEIPGISLDLGVHCHHLLSFLTGYKPISTICDQASNGFVDGVIDDITALVRYEHGFRGQFWFSKSSLGYRNGLRIRIFGTEGSAFWHQENPEILQINKVTGEQSFIDRSSLSHIANNVRYNRFKVGHPSGFIEAFANLYKDIFHSLLNHFKNEPLDNDYVFGVDHAIEGLALLEAMQSSTRTGRWTDLPVTLEKSDQWKNRYKNISYNN